MFVLACATPLPKQRQRTKVSVRDVKQAIRQAQNLCMNYEDTPECRAAWELVDELSTAFAHGKDRRGPEECDA
jgi:hypothetical protein